MDINYNDVNFTCNCQGRGGRISPEQLNEVLNGMFEDYISGGTLEQYIINAMAETYTQTQIDAMLSDMATMTWVEAQGYLTQHQDLSGYATDQELAEATADLPSKNWVVGHTSLALEPVYQLINDLQSQITACCGTGPDTGDTPTFDYTIEVTYNVTSTTDYTPIVNNIAGIQSIKYGPDDVDINVVYQFPATGLRTLVFTFNGTSSSEKFRDMDNVVEVKVGKDTYLSYGNFMECPNLTAVTFAAGSKTPSTTQFYGDTALASVSGIETSNWTTVPIYLFSGCTSLTQDITLPNSILTIERQAFALAPIRNLTIPASIQSIDYDAITHITGYVRFMGTIPPSVSFDGEFVNFRGNYPIYVPASAVDVYKAVYPSVATRIQAWS